jgi:hypothetical protein
MRTEMKTFLSENTIAGFPGTQRLRASDLRFGSVGAAKRTVPAWLPAPPVTPPRKRTQARSTSGVWIRSGSESFGERFVSVLLVVAAAIAIGYGFNCLLDLVANWAGFNAGVAQLIH